MTPIGRKMERSISSTIFGDWACAVAVFVFYLGGISKLVESGNSLVLGCFGFIELSVGLAVAVFWVLPATKGAVSGIFVAFLYIHFTYSECHCLGSLFLSQSGGLWLSSVALLITVPSTVQALGRQTTKLLVAFLAATIGFFVAVNMHRIDEGMRYDSVTADGCWAGARLLAESVRFSEAGLAETDVVVVSDFSCYHCRCETTVIVTRYANAGLNVCVVLPGPDQIGVARDDFARFVGASGFRVVVGRLDDCRLPLTVWLEK